MAAIAGKAGRNPDPPPAGNRRLKLMGEGSKPSFLQETGKALLQLEKWENETNKQSPKAKLLILKSGLETVYY